MAILDDLAIKYAEALRGRKAPAVTHGFLVNWPLAHCVEYHPLFGPIDIQTLEGFGQRRC
eukprot:2095807-Amphidinium_carterae.1